MLPEDAMYDNMLETLAYIRFRHPRRCSRRQAHDEIEQLIPLPIVAMYRPQSEILSKMWGFFPEMAGQKAFQPANWSRLAQQMD